LLNSSLFCVDGWRPWSVSEVLNNSQSYLIDGSHIFAASQEKVEADRKGQRGQKTEHDENIPAPDLKCAFINR
jgi:hypothetical protein